MKKILIGFMVLMGVGSLSYAGQTFTNTITSTSLVGTTFQLQPRESLSYSMVGSGTGTLHLERSVDGSNFAVILTSTSRTTSNSLSGTEFAGDKVTFFRWRASTMTSGSFPVSLSDRDDVVSEITNNKKTSIVRFFDDSVRFFSGKIGLGDSSVAASTLTTSGKSEGNFSSAYLSGTTAAVEGSLLVATAPVSGQGVSVIVSSAVSGLTSWVGVAKEAAAVGSIVEYYYSGYVLALTTGTVGAGNVLISATAPGYLAAGVPASGANVGVALATGTASGGLTKIRLR